MESLVNLCPCCSGMTYDKCCKPFHEGMQPGNALQLMRSRYSAYALNIADYIIATTHPDNPQYLTDRFSWKLSISKFSSGTCFQKLEILNFKEKSNLATVTFKAHLSQNGQDATFTEKSRFEKVNHLWLYLDGQMIH